MKPTQQQLDDNFRVMAEWDSDKPVPDYNIVKWDYVEAEYAKLSEFAYWFDDTYMVMTAPQDAYQRPHSPMSLKDLIYTFLGIDREALKHERDQLAREILLSIRNGERDPKKLPILFALEPWKENS